MQEIIHKELPTKDELLSALRGEDGPLVYDADEKRVGVQNVGQRYCSICDAPAGEVQLQRVYPKGSAQDKLFGEPFICFRGNCSGQRNIALMRPFKMIDRLAGTRRLTAKGKALQWVVSDESRVTQEYTLTSREHDRRKTARKQQVASRRANRGQ